MANNLKLSARAKINKYYTDTSRHEKLMEIKPQGQRKSDEYINETYKIFNITRFDSKSDYELLVRNNITEGVKKKDFLKGIPREQRGQAIENAVNEIIDKEWKFYQHRDDLIATGQYEEFRYNDYRDKYIENMKKWMVDQRLIDTMKNASLEELKRIIQDPNSAKDDKNKNTLPVLGFTYSQVTGPQLAETEESIMEAFKHAGVALLDTNVADEEIVKYARAKVYVSTERGTASNAYRRLRATDRPETDTYENLFDSMLTAYKQDRLNIHFTKAHNIYIPFVGSSRSGTKNAAFMELFEKYAKGKGVNFG